MVINNKTTDKRVFGTVTDPDIKKDYIGLETETANVTVNTETKEISVDVITEGLLDWSGEDAKKAYPAPLGRDALVRADMALIGIQEEQQRAVEAEKQLEVLIGETADTISVGDGKNYLKIQAETERAKSAEEDLDEKISNSNAIFNNFVTEVDNRFKETSKNIDKTKLDLQAEIRQTNDTLSDEVHQTAQIFDKKIEQVTDAHNKFEQVVADTYSTKKEVSDLNKKVNENKSDTDKQIESLTSNVESQISTVKDNLSTELQEVSQTLTSSIEKLTSDQTNFKNYVSETYATKTQLSEVDKKVTDNKLSTNLQIDSLKSEVKDSFDVTNSNLADVEQRVADVESTYATKTYVYDEVHSAITLSKQLVESVDLINNTVTIDNAIVNPVAGVLYMLKDPDADVSDIYKEYTLIDEQLTLIGDTSVSLDGYATEQWVKDQKYLTTHQDLSDYAKTVYVDEQIDHIVTYVEESIDAIPEVDLTPYAKKTDIPDVSAFIAEIPAEYITEEELDDKGFYNEAAVTQLLSNIKFIDGGTSASILK